jgi:hypothetical protein
MGFSAFKGFSEYATTFSANTALEVDIHTPGEGHVFDVP